LNLIDIDTAQRKSKGVFWGDKVKEIYKNLLIEFVEILKEKFMNHLVSVVVFGSVARNMANKYSDIDVCIVLRDLPKSSYKRSKMIYPCIKELQERESYQFLCQSGYYSEISPIIYTPEEIVDTKPVFLDMVDDAVLMYDDGTFDKKLKELRKRMEELGSQKVYLGDGTWYWKLKPDLKFGEIFEI